MALESKYHENTRTSVFDLYEKILKRFEDFNQFLFPVQVLRFNFGHFGHSRSYQVIKMVETDRMECLVGYVSLIFSTRESQSHDSKIALEYFSDQKVKTDKKGFLDF